MNHSMGVMSSYNMVFEWKTDQCAWIFKSWASTTQGQFFVGCLLTFLISFLSAGFGWMKQNYIQKHNSKLHQTFMFILGYALKMIVMLLMMSMNIYVNMLIVIGTAAGYVIFQNLKRNKKLKKNPLQ